MPPDQTPTTEATTTEATTTATTTPAQQTPTEGGFLNMDSTQSAETTEATTTETTETTTDKPTLIAGKYKTQDDLVKAHKELESKLGKLSATPESYELSDEIVEATGLNWTSDEQKADTYEVLKDIGLRQDQFEKLMPLYAQRVNEEIGRRIHIVDDAVEQTSLKKEWGSDFDSNLKEVGEFAKTLPRELVMAPLHHSAAGMKLLHQMMTEKRGPALISNNDSGPANRGSLQARLEEIVADPAYGTNTAQGEKLQQEAYNLSKRIAATR